MKQYVLTLIVALVSFGAYAQDSPCDNKWGTDSVETKKQVSMFGQYFQEKKYLESYPYWNYLFENAPCVMKNVTVNGPIIVKQQINAVRKDRKAAYASRKEQYTAEKEKKEELKAAGVQADYDAHKEVMKATSTANKAKLDSFSTVLDGLCQKVFDSYAKRIELHGQEGFVKGKWANDIVKLTPDNLHEGLAMFSESMKLEGNKTTYKVPSNYIYAGVVKGYKKDKLSLDSLFLMFDEVTPIIEANIAKYTAPGVSAKDSAKGLKWLTTQEKVINFMKPYLSCDKLTELKQPSFAEKGTDASWLKATISLLDRGGCESKPFYLQCSEALFSLEPSSDAALSLAKAFGKQGQSDKAASYYNKAADLATSDEAKYDIYIKLAKTAKNNKEYSTVRDYARKALGINPNSGEAYILIGDAYAASATSCGTGDLGRGGVYLVAVDKYAKAKSVDPSVAEDAQSKINKYAAYFPNKEQAFFKGINAGASYRVGCWIQESTSVRFGG